MTEGNIHEAELFALGGLCDKLTRERDDLRAENKRLREVGIEVTDKDLIITELKRRMELLWVENTRLREALMQLHHCSVKTACPRCREVIRRALHPKEEK